MGGNLIYWGVNMSLTTDIKVCKMTNEMKTWQPLIQSEHGWCRPYRERGKKKRKRTKQNRKVMDFHFTTIYIFNYLIKII